LEEGDRGRQTPRGPRTTPRGGDSVKHGSIIQQK
jgi:hypothetical protein